MKKFLSATLAFILSLSLLSGCGSDSGKHTTEPAFNPIRKSAQGKLTAADLEEPERLNKALEKIRPDWGLSDYERVNKANTQVKKIIRKQGLKIDGIHKGEDCLIVKFKSGILFYYPLGSYSMNSAGEMVTVRTIHPYYSTGREGIDEDGALLRDNMVNPQLDLAAWEISKSAGDTTCAGDINDKIEFSDLKQIFTKNSIVIWDGHGGYFNGEGITPGFLLPLGEDSFETEMFLNDPYMNALLEAGHLVYCLGNRLCITSEFINESGFDLSGSAFFFTCCHMMQDDAEDENQGESRDENEDLNEGEDENEEADKGKCSFASALENCGAEVSFGFNKSVHSVYAADLLTTLLKRMCEPDPETGELTSISKALDYAKRVSGVVDFGDIGAIGLIHGDKDYHFNTSN